MSDLLEGLTPASADRGTRERAATSGPGQRIPDVAFAGSPPLGTAAR